MVSILLFMCHIFFNDAMCKEGKLETWDYVINKQTSKSLGIFIFKISENSCHRERVFLFYFLSSSTFSTKQTILDINEGTKGRSFLHWKTLLGSAPQLPQNGGWPAWGDIYDLFKASLLFCWCYLSIYLSLGCLSHFMFLVAIIFFFLVLYPAQNTLELGGQ